jgi:hypothetical protein
MQDFLETLLYIIIGLWILRLIVKWAFPYMLKFFIGRVAKKAQQGFQNQTTQEPTNKNQENQQFESHSKNGKEKVGEYIDFEEID